MLVQTGAYELITGRRSGIIDSPLLPTLQLNCTKSAYQTEGVAHILLMRETPICKRSWRTLAVRVPFRWSFYALGGRVEGSVDSHALCQASRSTASHNLAHIRVGPQCIRR